MRWPETAVLFRAPAGPRRGFGHLLRCRALARALGVRPVVALRATATTAQAARRLGVTLVSGAPALVLRRTRARVLVVDDLVASAARRWIAAARALGCRVASIHDLGIGCLDADLVIDGSVTNRARVDRRRSLSGLRYAVIDPAFAVPVHRRRRGALRVLVALGGGPRGRLALAIARAVAACVPQAVVRVAGGLADQTARGADPRVTWTGPLDGLRQELSASDIAVVGGGVSLYEACAAGVAPVGVPVVPAQRPTVAAFARLGACRWTRTDRPGAAAVAGVVAALAADAAGRRRLAHRARRLVDGRGALRVSAVLAPWARVRRAA
jgi:UDP-2,4-diacetamido-2,4,6-trideoxy-beta-L-altropyranose hydrolase